MKKLIKLTTVLLLTAGLTACSDYLEPTTPVSKPIESIETVDDLKGLMNDAYSELSSTSIYGRNYIIFGDIRAMNAFSNGASGRFTSPFKVVPDGSGAIWATAYDLIANCNIIINSEIEAEGVSQVKGEAYVMRAFAHLIILKVYGQQHVDGSDLGVPYITTFREQENFFPGRPPVQETLNKIEADFQTGIELMDPSITGPATRITYYSALALQSRFYMYVGDYAAASAAAKAVIDSGVYSLVSADNYVAAWAEDGQPSVMLEVAMTQTDSRGSNSIFQIVTGESYGDVEVTEDLVNLFGPNDVRADLYASEVTSSDVTTPRLNYRVVGKYPDQYKNVPVIRYAEVILNYAEAQARLGNAAEALIYLNKIPANRNADLYLTASIDNILLERRKELAMEGRLYWTLVRTGRGVSRTNYTRSEVVTLVDVKVVPMGDFKLAYPIPTEELTANPNMVQNQGY